MRTYNDELYHYGVLGMKWGVRRYRNEDGSLTPAGKKRYSSSNLRINRKKNNYDNYHEDYKKAHTGKSVKYMSNQELNDVNRRLQAERQYSQLTKKTSAGKKAVDTFIHVSGTITSVAAAYSVYKNYGSIVVKSLKKIGKAKVN